MAPPSKGPRRNTVALLVLGSDYIMLICREQWWSPWSVAVERALATMPLSFDVICASDTFRYGFVPCRNGFLCFRMGRPFLAAAALPRGERRLESRRQTESPPHR